MGGMVGVHVWLLLGQPDWGPAFGLALNYFLPRQLTVV